MQELLKDIGQCTICEEDLPLKPRPVVQFNEMSKILVIGQAPGKKVHDSGIPWNDASGKRLRQWLGVDAEVFYNPSAFGIVPMGFCYPGKGKSGDLPPRKECAPHWHSLILQQLKKVELTLLIGQYAQRYYLKEEREKNLTETVKHFQNYRPHYFVLPHPSPRNQFWLRKNPWFEESVIPVLRQMTTEIIGK